MKTKLTLLTLLPVLMLASCGDGKEIKDEAKIKELKDSISEKAKERLKKITGLKNVDDLIVSKTLTDGSYHRKIIDIETTKANLENPCK
jgi:protein involved in sex pheromone biosynthesis